MLITEKVKVKWNSRNKKHFESCGYNFTGWKQEFTVDVNDLLPTSEVEVQVECDYCKKKITKKYKKYTSGRKIIEKDSCHECRTIKGKEAVVEKYGVTSVMKIKEVQQKAIDTIFKKYGVYHLNHSEEIVKKQQETNMRKYGVKCTLQDKNIREKMLQSIFEKYGVYHISQLDEVKDKIRQTNLNKYGVEHYSQTDEYKERVKQTNLEKFGVEYILQNSEIRAKQIKTLYENGTQKSSKQQRYLCKLLRGNLNFPVDFYSLDILLNNNIFIEYNGGGHWLNIITGRYSLEEHENKERRRYYYLSRKGYKQIEIISRKNKLPSDEKLIEMIKLAKDYLNTGHSWFCFDIDNSIIKCSQYEKEFDYGVLRYIKNKDLENVVEGGDIYDTAIC